MDTTTTADIVIVGAGLAGLTCAMELGRQGLSVIVLEASGEVGGRVRTDEHEGFLLDHGFQVLLTAYPTAREYLDYDALDLRSFYPGAIIKTGKMSEKMADPFRRPVDGLKTVLSPIGTAGDKLRVGQLRTGMIARSLDSIYKGEGERSIDWLRQQGYSEPFITQFFRPFYGGVMLDRELETSHKMLEFTYKMFAAGDTAVPAKGMGRITQQLASNGGATIRLQSPVSEIVRGQGVRLQSGEMIHADQIVIATDQDFAREHVPDIGQNGWRGVRCLYFAAPEPPENEPILVLNGEDEGVINNLCVMSRVSPHYAPRGESLISISVLGEGLELDEQALSKAVRAQASLWYGKAQVETWRHLRTYDIGKGQPDQSGSKLDKIFRDVRFGEELFVCGDHRETASIEGAMHSGKRAAQEVVRSRAR